MAQGSSACVQRKHGFAADVDTGLSEDRPSDLAGALTFGNPPTVADVVLGLHRAAQDPKITALIGYLPTVDLSLAQIQEIREAIIAFGETGKRTVVFAPSFGEMGGGLGAYYLATAFKEIRMQPTGEIGVAGISVESPYFRKALEKSAFIRRSARAMNTRRGRIR